MLIFANNDICLGSREFLLPFVEVLSNNDVGVAFPNEMSPSTLVNRADGYWEESADGFIYGAFFAMRRDVYEEIGGFCEEYQGYGCEEADLAIQMIRRNYKLAFLPNVHLSHAGGTTFAATRQADIPACASNILIFERRWGYDTQFDPTDGGDIWTRWIHYWNCLWGIERNIRKVRDLIKGDPLIGIGIITHNRAEHLYGMIEAVRKTTLGMNTLLFVSDDGSKDGKKNCSTAEV
jgi:GT2 family glycosyltransferase